jgi:hypothetical protein
MSSGVVQISVLVGCAGVVTRCAIQLVVVIWSLRADEDGRKHAIELLKVLRLYNPKRG